MITLVYISNRREPRIRWFLESLKSPPQTADFGQPYKLVFVDFYRNERAPEFLQLLSDHQVKHVDPMPNVWCGPFRLAQADFFAAAAFRNTGLCYAEDGYIGWIDDLSVLLPTWVEAARDSMAIGYVALGSYRKVRELVVKDGRIQSFVAPTAKRTLPDGREEEFCIGDDTRLRQVTQDVTPCDGGWLYGCSLFGPVESFLKVNGWPEWCDSMGHEDCVLGKTLRNAGVDLRYCRKMQTLESEEDHWQEGNFKKYDKGPPGTNQDKSHKAIAMGERCTYYYTQQNIRELRQKILSGQPFPTTGLLPTHDWFDSQPVSEFK